MVGKAAWEMKDTSPIGDRRGGIKGTTEITGHHAHEDGDEVKDEETTQRIEEGDVGTEEVTEAEDGLMMTIPEDTAAEGELGDLKGAGPEAMETEATTDATIAFFQDLAIRMRT